ncbi:MAG TPA: glycine cleavage system protein H, partial [Candidatus Marinimicrobia bacterium]|nr:glycine cleavage system protein H [Candidatus Neomarinimicrobiota bacterium]
DIVFVELPEVGKSFNAGDAFGTIEAVKTVTDLFSPISGKIVAINEGLDSDPGKVNSDPYGDGWLVKIRLSDPDEKDGLMSSIAYEEIIG